MIAGSFALAFRPMTILAVVTGVLTVLFSSVIWMIESPESAMVTESLLSAAGRGRSSPFSRSLQDICFGTIPASAWWVVTTMTTVGYGDCAPITSLGKLVGVFVQFGGILILAMPITVLGNAFSTMTEMYEEDFAKFSMQDYDGDGVIDEEELRDYVRTKRREGVLRKDVDTSITALFAKYDPNKNGVIEQEEWIRLQSDIVIEKKDPIGEVKLLVMKAESQDLERDAAIASLRADVDLRLGRLESQIGQILHRLGGPAPE
eukprot:CAMPEP_0181189850 /NCGR_PEP_ID=MMETSP1096-20121128/11883_1 /TAXON_ID=156174 ORGANISM="Chrysochromulina ericina, Strain CCMP281" /NCGR_SAMPLE_ID=MMETSP1096 /ASSEMBLY_ACC=CAM_ASM_000453 /LENGTH=260 /DNA_ID=CAMNT_0023279033 /DNA_START=1 /DNA_END=780 /DNA_ORIENTATION=-